MPRTAKSRTPSLAATADLGDVVEADFDDVELSDGDDALEALALEGASVDAIRNSAKVPSRARKAVVPPAHVPADMTLFEYVRQCNPPIDQKLVDIACSQAMVPDSLRNDAQQEIHIMWSGLKPDVERFKPGQIAAYAHRMARHAALRTRRELGSPVRLPGSAFRRRADGSSYVTPGVLAAPLNWDDMEAWFQADGGEGGGDFGDLAQAAASVESMVTVEADAGECTEEQQVRIRLQVLEAHKDKLTPIQLNILRLLVDGHSYEDIMNRTRVKRGVLMREVAIACSVLGQN